MLAAITAVALTTALSFVLFTHLAPVNLAMLYLVATVWVAARGRRGPAVACSVLSVAAFDFFFVPPRFSFSVHDAEYLLTFAVMLATALVISHLTLRLRLEAAAAKRGERRTALVHAFSQALARTRDVQEVLTGAAKLIEETFGGPMAAYLPGADGKLAPVMSAGGASGHDHAVAQWVFDTGEPAGLGTASLPASTAFFAPLRREGRPIGVLSVAPRGGWALDGEQRLLLDAFAEQVALALEADRLAAQAESERTRSALLSSVSHDLRTPLSGILGSATALMEKPLLRDAPRERALVESIATEAARLERLVRNLLDVTRLEAGGKLRRERYPLEELAGAALARLEGDLAGRDVAVRFEPELPPVPVDATLIDQVFTNLLENALRHTPAGAPLEIAARRDGGMVRVTVADRGPGLEPGSEERVFEKFAHGAGSRGAGLGLAICRAAVAAHGGRIWAAPRPGGGAEFHFTLPVEA